MGGTVKRTYRSPARAAAAARTRAAIRSAAAGLFLEQGFSSTTMKAVAQRAGIGERTLYDAFPTKGRLFEHLLSVAIGGDEQPVRIADRPEFREALAQPDPHAAVRHYAAYSAAVLERAAPLITVAIESAGADPALRRIADTGAAATRANTLAFVRALAKHGHVDGKATERAMAAYALVVPLVHQHLRRDVGWSARRYRAWLEEQLVRALL